jgi:hypothetical protein
MDELVVVVLGGETAAPQRRCREQGMATENVGRRLGKADGGGERVGGGREPYRWGSRGRSTGQAMLWRG